MAKTKKKVAKKKVAKKKVKKVDNYIWIKSIEEVPDDLKKEVKKFCEKASMQFDFESSSINKFKDFIQEIFDSEEESLDTYSINTTYMAKVGKYTISVIASQSRNDMCLSDPEWDENVLIEF